MKRTWSLAAVAVVAVVGVGAWAITSMVGSHAQMQHGTMQHGDHGAMAEDAGPSTRAYMEANMRMHEGMAIEFTGNADVDFARGMIPHHRGAIDMARIVLEHGEDPEIRVLAEEIIAAQESEIAFLQQWLEANAE